MSKKFVTHADTLNPLPLLEDSGRGTMAAPQEGGALRTGQWRRQCLRSSGTRPALRTIGRMRSDLAARMECTGGKACADRRWPAPSESVSLAHGDLRLVEAAAARGRRNAAEALRSLFRMEPARVCRQCRAMHGAVVLIRVIRHEHQIHPRLQRLYGRPARLVPVRARGSAKSMAVPAAGSISPSATLSPRLGKALALSVAKRRGLPSMVTKGPVARTGLAPPAQPAVRPCLPLCGPHGRDRGPAQHGPAPAASAP